ncbi:hypothetical protein OXX80_009720 [Metschnikowia pulcherrima]
MDVKEIKSTVSNLEKSTDDSTILKLLNILNDGVQPTEKLLRETKVGVAVNKYRSSNSSEISSLVKKMIKKWKEVVQNEKTAKKTAKQPSEQGNTVQATETRPVPGSTAGKFHSGPRNPKTDGVNTTIYDNSTRNASVSALYTALAIERDDDSAAILAVAQEIESEVFKAEFAAVTDSYRNKLRTFTMNLRNKKTRNCMPPSEMAPEALKKEIEKLHKQNLFDAQGATEKRAVTDRFTCGKCKHKKVSYYQMQTRSADEPLTTFCTCENCGNRWKFS